MIYVAVFCTVVAFVVNKVNIKYLHHQTSIEWFGNQKVSTADDASYLRPADNFLDKGDWKDNSIGYSSYYQRTPAYGILYLFFKLIFNQNAIGFLLLFQTILFGVSVYWFGKIAFLLSHQSKTALIFQLIYGLIPSSYGFVFYTITEGITPFLMLGYLYVLVKLYHNIEYKKHHVLLALIGFVILLVRPHLIPFVLIYPLIVLFKTGVNQMVIKQLVLYFSISFLGLGVWMIRGYKISGHFIGLASIYDNTNNSPYRPTHYALGNLYRIWEHQPEKLHQSLVPIWMNTINGEPQEKDISNAVNRLPGYITDFIPKNKWNNLFTDYQNTIKTQKTYFDKHLSMPETLSDEDTQLISKIDSITSVLKRKFWFRNHFITPLKSFRKTAIHSNLNLYIFQQQFRGNLFVELLRYFSFTLFSLSMFISLWLWLFRFDVLIRAVSFAIFGYTFYLIYFQRMNETRYMHPIYPVALLLMVFLVSKIKVWKLRR